MSTTTVVRVEVEVGMPAGACVCVCLRVYVMMVEMIGGAGSGGEGSGGKGWSLIPLFHKGVSIVAQVLAMPEVIAARQPMRLGGRNVGPLVSVPSRSASRLSVDGSGKIIIIQRQFIDEG